MVTQVTQMTPAATTERRPDAAGVPDGVPDGVPAGVPDGSGWQIGSVSTEGTKRASLLWPPGYRLRPGPPRLDERTFADLDLQEVLLTLTGHDDRRDTFVRGVLSELCSDPAVIRFRQGALDDLLADGDLRARLAEVALSLAELLRGKNPRRAQVWPVGLIARRVVELEQYVNTALQLRTALEVASPQSAAMLGLRDFLRALTGSPVFRTLQDEVPRMRAALDNVCSITIGINLTQDLSPDTAAIVSISAEKIEGKVPLLGRLLGITGPRALSPLFQVDLGSDSNPLYRDLRKLLQATVSPVEAALGSYHKVNAYLLTDLEAELSLLLNAARLVQRLENVGLPMCRPDVAPVEERLTVLDDAYSVSLALRLNPPPGEVHRQSALALAEGDPAAPGRVVTNAVRFDDASARIWVLTGPNRGGKTTYTRAVGQAQVLFQAGLYAPARAGRLSPATAIYTHFATQESGEPGMGRLDEEAERLARIFHVATPHSLILLNEVLAGTSTIEALGLATDAVRGLRLLGARAIYTTHLHELAAGVDEVNATTPGESAAGSLVAYAETGMEGGQAVIGLRHRRTFRIIQSPPRNVSYASEIAEQHGISYPQLARLFQERGLLPPPAKG